MSAATDKRKSPSHDFRERVRDWLDERNAINKGLEFDGPRLIRRLLLSRSLRGLARESKLSPTYLSRVADGSILISPGSFIRLSEMEDA